MFLFISKWVALLETGAVHKKWQKSLKEKKKKEDNKEFCILWQEDCVERDTRVKWNQFK